MITVFLVSLAPYIWLFSGSYQNIQAPPLPVFLATLTACLIYHGLFLHSVRRGGYCLSAVTYFYFWIFMGMAPLMCLLTGRWLWGDMTHEMGHNIVTAVGLSLLFIACFHLAKVLAYRRGDFSRFLVKGGTVTDARLFLGLWFSLAMSIAVLWGLGIEGTFLRAGYDAYVTSGVLALFIQNFIRPLPLLIGVPMMWVAFKSRMTFAQPRTWLALATVTLALTVNFPLSVARFYGWTVICVFFYYAYMNIRESRRIWLTATFLILGFLGSFVVDTARFAKSALELKENISISTLFSVESFYAGHVDAFEILVYGTQYVEERGTTMGRQLLGVALFWVPREMWPDKPIATGPLMGSSFINILSKTENTNLAAPIVLEGYINFGVTGVMLFGLFGGYLVGTLDRALMERRSARREKQGMIFGIDAIAAPLLGLWIYILRGSLLSSFAYASGIVFAGFIAWRFFFRRHAGDT